MRIGTRQRAVLEWAQGFSYQDLHGRDKHVPAYMGGSLPDSITKSFIYDTEFERFCKDLERRGWIRIENRWFVYLTDEGKATLAGKEG